jgi:hypothetical protein
MGVRFSFGLMFGVCCMGNFFMVDNVIPCLLDFKENQFWLPKWKFIIWFYMCKSDGESFKHIFIHCEMAREIRYMAFALYDVMRVMPNSVKDLFVSWMGGVRNVQNLVLLKATPMCLMWCIWKEPNARALVGVESSLFSLKFLFFRTLFEWMIHLGGRNCDSVLGGINLFCCNP